MRNLSTGFHALIRYIVELATSKKSSVVSKSNLKQFVTRRNSATETHRECNEYGNDQQRKLGIVPSNINTFGYYCGNLNAWSALIASTP